MLVFCFFYFLNRQRFGKICNKTLKTQGLKKEIRKRLGEKVRHQLRIVPDLDFYVDDSLDYIENIDRLLS